MPKEPRRVPTILGWVQNGPVLRPRGAFVFVAPLQTAYTVFLNFRSLPALLQRRSPRGRALGFFGLHILKTLVISEQKESLRSKPPLQFRYSFKTVQRLPERRSPRGRSRLFRPSQP